MTKLRRTAIVIVGLLLALPGVLAAAPAAFAMRALPPERRAEHPDLHRHPVGDERLAGCPGRHRRRSRRRGAHRHHRPRAIQRPSPTRGRLTVTTS